MIGETPIGARPLGALDDELTTAILTDDVIEVLNLAPEIEGAAFQFLLSNPQARRRYLVELFPRAV